MSGKAIQSRFRVCDATLRSWANTGRVRCIRIGAAGGKRLYSLPDIERTLHVPAAASKEAAAKPRARVLYCRVSSAKQRADLERQRADLHARYPEHEVVEDIASGINFHRRGLLSLLDRAVRGGVEEVVVAHRDRLCRIAFELVEHVLGQCGCKVVVCDGSVAAAASADAVADDLREDLLSIVTYFVASNNGRRSAENRKRRARAAEEGGDGDEEEGEEGSGPDAGAEGGGNAPQGEGREEAL
ncbi:MAG: IS607 family transposase [Dehalococcoidia bacterium]|nr:IS607 family transposase [Dehalococcoidia bacterium]